MKRKIFAILLAMCVPTGASRAGDDGLTIQVKAGKQACQSMPVCVPLSLPKQLADRTAVVLTIDDRESYGQFTAPSLTTEHIKPSKAGLVRRDLHFVLTLEADKSTTVTWQPAKSQIKAKEGFRWNTAQDDYEDLYFASVAFDRIKKEMRYMKTAYDPSTPEARNKSYKVFHHLYDRTGKRFVTNGGHADPTIKGKLLYPHHRGLMYGFNRITYGNGQKCDTWHCRGDDFVEHVKTLAREAGPVLGRHRVLLNWHGSKKEVFAQEEREMTVYNVYGGTLVEFASRLKTTGGPVKLDGDPQHAGFQFRAHNDVATKSKKLTYYLRPDGKGKLGETRNYDHRKKKGPVDLPWKAMSFVLGDQRYTAAYLDHPRNPGEARHSERDYGRFGYYFEYNLTKEAPLLVNMRVWLQEGEMTMARVRELQQDFVSPPTATVKK